jgi:NodT family efflux transporter outer membrane factor (OMF) lipoprotein
LLQLGVLGCAHEVAGLKLPLQDAPPFSASGEAIAPNRWWAAFDDSALDRQIDRSLDGSFTLAAALQRLRAAQALVRREASDLFPDVNGIADAEGVFLSDGPEASLFALGLGASYEVDLWGRIESHVEAEQFRASATAADYYVVALTLSAEIARTWYALIEARAQLDLLDEQIKTNETGLELQEARFGLGQIRSADVLRQRQLVVATREQTLIVKSQIEVLEHRLAVLQGRPPQRASYVTGANLPPLPPLPDTGLPSELLMRRPDVFRDFLAIWAADRDLASAVSDQYPRVSLSGSVTTAAESPENLFSEWIAVTAAQLIAPLIDGGQRRAEVARNASVLRLRIAEYSDTVLNAFREVEDALAREEYQLMRIENLNAQVKLARQASAQLREQYLIGETEYLDVLTAITQEQRLQRETLSARLELVLNRIALYLALAGDFEMRPPMLEWQPPRVER